MLKGSGALCRQRTAVEDQISHFGQTPSQLFRRKHPKRGPPPPPSFHPLLNGPDAMKLSLVGMPPSRRCCCYDWRCLVVSRNETLMGAPAKACHAMHYKMWCGSQDQDLLLNTGCMM